FLAYRGCTPRMARADSVTSAGRPSWASSTVGISRSTLYRELYKHREGARRTGSAGRLISGSRPHPRRSAIFIVSCDYYGNSDIQANELPFGEFTHRALAYS